MVASNAGAPTDPFWYANIVANPIVQLQDGAGKKDMRAREVFGKEKDEWWKRADAAYSEFPAYRARVGREIPVLVIEPLRAKVTIIGTLSEAESSIAREARWIRTLTFDPLPYWERGRVRLE